jgi:hypothetical protein
LVIASTTRFFVGDEYVSEGDTITATYRTTSNLVKGFTLGYRTPDTAIGGMSLVTGDGNEASGNYSTACGYNNISRGISSHAEGNSCQALGSGSHAEGSYCIASKDDGHAEGLSTESSGTASHAEGYHTIASGSRSHAEGEECVASGANSHAGGYHTIASAQHQTAIGEWNIQHDYTPGAGQDHVYFIVGCGFGEAYRKDALTVTENNLSISGTLIQGSDRRLKDHIDYLNDDAVEFVRSLKPAHYIKDGEHHVGFYAQDVEESDPWDCMTGEMNGYKTLGYMELIAPLVAYVQKLEERIEKLERRK